MVVNWMGGKKNAIKARIRNTERRAQVEFFSRQRLKNRSILPAATGVKFATPKAGPDLRPDWLRDAQADGDHQGVLASWVDEHIRARAVTRAADISHYGSPREHGHHGRARENFSLGADGRLRDALPKPAEGSTSRVTHVRPPASTNSSTEILKTTDGDEPLTFVNSRRALLAVFNWASLPPRRLHKASSHADSDAESIEQENSTIASTDEEASGEDHAQDAMKEVEHGSLGPFDPSSSVPNVALTDEDSESGSSSYSELALRMGINFSELCEFYDRKWQAFIETRRGLLDGEGSTRSGDV